MSSDYYYESANGGMDRSLDGKTTALPAPALAVLEGNAAVNFIGD